MRFLIAGLVFTLLTACATGGSSSRIADRFMSADANGDGFISRAEAPSRLDFDVADTNRDGLLSLTEIEAYTQSLRG